MKADEMASDMCFYCQVLAKLLVLDTDHNCRDGQERTPLIWAASYGTYVQHSTNN